MIFFDLKPENPFFAPLRLCVRSLFILYLRAQQRLDRAALVHGAIALRHLVERQSQIEDLAGVDLSVPDQINQLGQEAPHWSRTPVQAYVAEEQLLAVEFNSMRDAD